MNPIPSTEAPAPSPRGLSAREAATRLADEGYNELPQPERRSLVRIVLGIVGEPMFGLLLASGLIYLALGDHTEALVLLGFATISVSIAVVQEIRSERVLAALRDLTSPRALVVRDGEMRRIPGREVVRGDLVMLAEGDRVPADALIVSGHDLAADESLLTGESVPARKRIGGAVPPSARPGGDDLPLVFAGTLIVGGEGAAEVIAIGARSEIGKIGKALGSIAAEPTRLARETRRIVRVMAIAGGILSLLVVILYGLMRGSWLDGLLGGIALSMSMLPEEFPLVLAVFMVMGAWRLSRVNVLTRRAATIETLGAATVLCTDKTGTLTQNRMTVAAVEPAPGALAAGTIVPGAASRPSAEVVATAALAAAPAAFDPMDKAIHAKAAELSGENRPLLPDAELVHVYGLRPELLAVTQVWSTGSRPMQVVAAKGAPEAIFRLCRLDDDEIERLGDRVSAMAANGMRVLGVARADFAGPGYPADPTAFAFRFVGLIGLSDPVRPAVPGAIGECREAGIRIVMVTGDYPTTAQAIAKSAGLPDSDVVAGAELSQLDPVALGKRLKTASVFARVMPEQKLLLVEALKAGGEVVAMIGDGVNDAPSLKAAHIGIAMGGRGTDVAREAAAIVLLDDDFRSVVTAIRLGRRIYDNLRKAMAFILAVHVPVAVLALVPLLLGLPLVLAPVHIAFLEMVIDPVCSIVFEAETEERDIMRRRPHDPRSRLLSAPLVAWSLLQGALAAIAVMLIYALALYRAMPENEARALAFVSLIVVNIVLILVNRAFDNSLRALRRRPNRALLVVLAVTAALLSLTFTWPPAEALFRFGPLHLDDIAACLGVGAVVFAVLELAKPLLAKRLRA